MPVKQAKKVFKLGVSKVFIHLGRTYKAEAMLTLVTNFMDITIYISNEQNNNPMSNFVSRVPLTAIIFIGPDKRLFRQESGEISGSKNDRYSFSLNDGRKQHVRYTTCK